MKTGSFRSASLNSVFGLSESRPFRFALITYAAFFMVLLCFSSSVCLAGDAADAGLVTSASGRVQYTDENRKDAFTDVSVLMKIRQGDIIKIGENSEAVFLFQVNGRREAWKGPVTVKISEAGGTAVENPGNIQPVVTSLPVDISDIVVTASSTDTVTGRTRAGIRVVRGFGENVEPAEASGIPEGKTVYEKMKKDLGDNDISPEIYMVDYYIATGSMNDAKKHIEIIKSKWGNNPDVMKWCSDIGK